MLNRADTILAAMNELASPEKMASMIRVGIVTDNALGVSITDLRLLAKRTSHNRKLAEQLWVT